MFNCKAFLVCLPLLPLAIACGGKSGKKESNPIQNQSKSPLSDVPFDVPHFRLQGNPDLFRVVDKSSVSVCIAYDKQAPADIELLKTWIKNSMEAWLKPVEELVAVGPKEFSFEVKQQAGLTQTQGDKNSPCNKDDDIVVRVVDQTSGDRPYADAESRSITILPQNGEKTVLHEIGHLFGLDDLYREGIWDCFEGIPQSVMCQNEKTTPYDHIAVKRTYCLYSDGKSESCFNHKKDSILAISPKKQGARRPVFIDCSAKGKNFTFAPYSIVNQNDQNALYSTDSRSVSETYSEDSIFFKFKIHDRSTQINTEISLTIDDKGILVDGKMGDRTIHDQYNGCRMDSGLIDYFATKSPVVGAKLKAESKVWNAGLDDLIFSSTVYIGMEQEIFLRFDKNANPEDLTLKIYSEQDPTRVIAEVPYDKLNITETSPSEIGVDITSLKLAPGRYRAILEHPTLPSDSLTLEVVDLKA